MIKRNFRLHPIRVFLAVGGNGGLARELGCNLTVALAMEHELHRHGVQVKVFQSIGEAQLWQEGIAACNLYQPDLAVALCSGPGKQISYQIKNWSHAKISKKLADCFVQRIQSFFPIDIGQAKMTRDSDWLNLVETPAILCETDFTDGQVESMQVIGKVYAMALLDFYEIPYYASQEHLLRYVTILGDDTKLDQSCPAVSWQGSDYVDLQQFAKHLGWAVLRKKDTGQIVLCPADKEQQDGTAQEMRQLKLFEQGKL